MICLGIDLQHKKQNSDKDDDMLLCVMCEPSELAVHVAIFMHIKNHADAEASSSDRKSMQKLLLSLSKTTERRKSQHDHNDFETCAIRSVLPAYNHTSNVKQTCRGQRQ